MASQAEPLIVDQPSISTGNIAKPTSSGDEPFINITRNNGVCFQATNTVSVQSYIDQFTEQQPAGNVMAASRISNSRVAIYLNTRDAVTSAVQQGFNYNGTFLQLTPLVLPTTKITLSNVYPEIPNAIIEKIPVLILQSCL